MIALVCGEGNTGEFYLFLIGVTCGNFWSFKNAFIPYMSNVNPRVNVRVQPLPRGSLG